MSASDEYDSYAVITDFSERERVSRLSVRMLEIESAPRNSKCATIALIARQEGVSPKTLERLFYKWRKGGDIALADKRKQTKATAGSRFYDTFKTYCEKNLNNDKAAYNHMMMDFASGAEMPFGTWRDVFRDEFPLSAVPKFCPVNWTPKGMTYVRLMQLRKSDPDRQIATAWNRRGQYAAAEFTLPVIRTRVGLPVGSVFQCDDVWHNIDVFAPEQSGTFNPLEFAIYDVRSAFKVDSLVKPRVSSIDPKTGREVRDNLKEMQFRFLLAHLVCTKGFHRDGATFIVERGTTAIRDNVQRRIASVPGFGRLLHFQVSGVMKTPAHAGLLMGDGGGNPRMKSLCECAHGIQHNLLASLPGSHGRDAAHKQESASSLVKYTASEIELARRIDPTLVPLLHLDILPFSDYLRYFKICEDYLMDSTDHRLEGWADCEVAEYRLRADSDSWFPYSALADMSPDKVAAISAVINSDKRNLTRTRRMSRREVWAAGQKDLIRWPIFDAPAFYDPRDARVETVRNDGTISFTDKLYYPGQRKIYVAELCDRNGLRRRLPACSKVRFYWNPLLSDQIWISDDDDNILGLCPVLKTAAWRDPESIKIAMGQKSAQIAAQMSDTRARHIPDELRRRVADKFNQFLLESARELKLAGGDYVDNALPSEDVLRIASDCVSSPPSREDSSADFLRLFFLTQTERTENERTTQQ